MTEPARAREGSKPGRPSGTKVLRVECPRAVHAEWEPATNRMDPADRLERDNEGRLPWLVPVRRAWMTASPFAFYRGSAGLMAADLASTPATGLSVQACGDAHLSNFGVFASPERQLAVDLNDFDETLPGPWEWDVKRLAASFMIVGRHRELDDETSHAITRAARSRRTGRRFAASPA